jgi:hypothetical protein
MWLLGAYARARSIPGCSIISEHHSIEKGRVEFVFRLPRKSTRERLDAELCKIAAELRGISTVRSASALAFAQL